MPMFFMIIIIYLKYEKNDIRLVQQLLNKSNELQLAFTIHLK